MNIGETLQKLKCVSLIHKFKCSSGTTEMFLFLFLISKDVRMIRETLRNHLKCTSHFSSRYRAIFCLGTSAVIFAGS